MTVLALTVLCRFGLGSLKFVLGKFVSLLPGSCFLAACFGSLSQDLAAGTLLSLPISVTFLSVIANSDAGVRVLLIEEIGLVAAGGESDRRGALPLVSFATSFHVP